MTEEAVELIKSNPELIIEICQYYINADSSAAAFVKNVKEGYYDRRPIPK